MIYSHVLILTVCSTDLFLIITVQRFLTVFRVQPPSHSPLFLLGAHVLQVGIMLQDFLSRKLTWHKVWREAGSPSAGVLHQIKVSSKRRFKYEVRRLNPLPTNDAYYMRHELP